MKFVIVLCILSALLLQIDASPVKLLERDARAVSRQQSTATNEVAPAAAPADDDEDDDDEDDDDDDGDIGDIGDLVDDDDEEDDDEEDDDDEEEDDTPQGQAAPAAGAAAGDDDEEDDDDDDDYLDRLFDDILGDDDEEDDDDEEVSPAASVQNIVAAQPPAAATIEDIAPVGQAAAGTGISDGVDLPLEGGNAADSSAANIGEDAPSATNNKNEGAVAAAAANDDAEEAEDDDDDDDDDDIIGDDVIEARREARALKNNIIDMSQDAFQERHNHFIDSIFERINRIVADNYDPFVVRLNARAELKDAASVAGTTTKAATAATTAKPKSSKKKRKHGKNEHRALKDATEAGDSNGSSSSSTSSLQKAQNKLQQQMEQLQHEQQNLKAVEPVEATIPDKNAKTPTSKDTTLTSTANAAAAVSGGDAAAASAAAESPEVRTVFTNESVKAGGGNHKKSSTKTHKHQSSNKTKAQKLKQSNTGTANHSGKVAEKYQNAEGSLSGLSSLKRVGNVKVTSDPEGRNSTIKAKFTLGPLVLRVEKSIKRGSVRNVKSATARTNEMIGRIKFSVVNDNATLMSIKVQQPKQVEVESKDNHDHTRELVWRRTPKIAKLVNEKLKLAVESIFTPQGVEIVRL